MVMNLCMHWNNMGLEKNITRQKCDNENVHSGQWNTFIIETLQISITQLLNLFINSATY